MDTSKKVNTKKRKKNTGDPGRDPMALPRIRPNVAGIDLGSREHWVCGPATADDAPNVGVFRTTTPQLQELADWLRAPRRGVCGDGEHPRLLDSHLRATRVVWH